MKGRSLFVSAVLFGVAAGPSFGADAGGNATAGRAFFRAQCALCHSAEAGDNGGAQGPNLAGVLGRKAASTGFSYSNALKASGLTWDDATLAHFLSSPTTVVPGSAMVIPVPQQSDRDNLLAYFAAARDGTLRAPGAPGGGAGGARPAGGGAPRAAGGPGGPGAGAPPPPPAPPKGEADWKKDQPGRVHRIEVAKLPAPYDTPSANNFPKFIPKPDGAQLSLPSGFKIETYLTGLTGPRAMRVAPNGDILLAETNAGRVQVLHPSADGKTATPTVFAQGLQQPYGIALYPAGDHPQWVYVAETNRVVRYPYKVGDTVASGVPEIIVPQLAPAGGGHFTRDIAFTPDGRHFYVSVGSGSNVPENLSKKTPEEVKAWEKEHGFGTTWDGEENRADLRIFDVNGDIKGRTYASGIRNCVGLTIQPATGLPWCAVNERDNLGDDLVPDYATSVKDGAWYGWPWYYMGKNEDPRLKGLRPDLAGKATLPDVPFMAHSAALNIKFYEASNGASAFPKEYVGDAIVVLHGSWNRAFRTGHKLVRLPMKNGKATGEYIDFMTGFIADDGNAWGRPAAIAELKDGSLLLSDDGANLIYRISYSKP
ncbi:MAG: PQQ-dependent sugar dehydrogenase [Pseudomonadota bacterium]